MYPADDDREECSHNIREFAGTHPSPVLCSLNKWQEDGSLDITPARKQIRGSWDACPTP
jgi:hypothetical protein